MVWATFVFIDGSESLTIPPAGVIDVDLIEIVFFCTAAGRLIAFFLATAVFLTAMGISGLLELECAAKTNAGPGAC
jgi:hypothetical protein